MSLRCKLHAFNAGVAAVGGKVGEASGAASQIQDASSLHRQESSQRCALLSVEKFAVGIAKSLRVVGPRQAIVILDHGAIDHGHQSCETGSWGLVPVKAARVSQNPEWKWRRGRDLNPRYGCPYAAFRVRCDRPLCHLSNRLKFISISKFSQQNP